MTTKKAVHALAIVSLFGFCGCASELGCDYQKRGVINGKGPPGAVLLAPPTAIAGETITLDASGSEIEIQKIVGSLFPTRCPEVVHFFEGTNDEEEPWEQIETISKPQTAGDPAKGHCFVTNAKIRFKVPAGPRPGTSQLKLGVAVGANYFIPLIPAKAGATAGCTAETTEEEIKARLCIPIPLFSNAIATVIVSTPAPAVVTPPVSGGNVSETQASSSTGSGSGSGSGSGGGGGSGPPANKPPVPKFFALVDPSVQGRPIDLDARESSDPDGVVTTYDWDYNGDGTFDETRTDGFGHVTNAGTPGNRPIILRVHDDKGATAVSAPLDQLVVAPTTFTEGHWGAPAEVEVFTPFDIAVNDDVSGADVISLDADDDGAFDDGLPNQTSPPGATKPQFHGMQYAETGLKRLAVRWDDNNAPKEFTITTELIKVTQAGGGPIPSATRAAAAAAGVRVSATLRPGTIT